ncbi:MAG: FadR family transcriptional regulator [Verrucomicrobiaceae bacterium]|nr:MAG: FadR family transcriptional regulator [Verrucomicrobiaceae bacterium]
MRSRGEGGLHRRVVEELGRKIVSGHLAAGVPLPVWDDLCDRLSVSRSVLREALRVLAEKGLLVARRKAGTFVTARDSWNMLDLDILEWRLETPEADMLIGELYELRRMLEPTAAYLAALRATSADFRKIETAYEGMANSADIESTIKGALQFQRAILSASGNELFKTLGAIGEPALVVNLRISSKYVQGRSHGILMRKRILDSIIDRDAPTARVTMQELIVYSKEVVDLVRAAPSLVADQSP